MEHIGSVVFVFVAADKGGNTGCLPRAAPTLRLSIAAVYIKILPVYIRVNDLRAALVRF